MMIDTKYMTARAQMVFDKPVEVWDKTEAINELGSTEYTYAKTSTVWAKITSTGSIKKPGQADTEYASASHIIIIRDGAIPTINNEMYFVFMGRKYDVEYFQPNLKNNGTVEVFCTLRIE